MSILKTTEKDYFIHQNQLIKIIADDLKVSPNKITLVTHQKNIEDQSKFEKITAIVKESKNVSIKYDVTKTQIKQLLSEHLKLQHFNCEYVCCVRPGTNGTVELNYINVIEKKPELRLEPTLNNAVVRMRNMRTKDSDTSKKIAIV